MSCHFIQFSLVYNIFTRCTTSYNQNSLFFQWARTHRDARIESSSISASRYIQILLKKGLPVATHRVHCEPSFRVVEKFAVRTETLRYVEVDKRSRRESFSPRRERASHPGVRASHPGMRVSHPGLRASHPDVRTSHPGVRTSHPDKRASHSDVRASHHDLKILNALRSTETLRYLVGLAPYTGTRD